MGRYTFWNPGQTSPEDQNRRISSPIKRTCVHQRFFFSKNTILALWIFSKYFLLKRGNFTELFKNQSAPRLRLELYTHKARRHATVLVIYMECALCLNHPKPWDHIWTHYLHCEFTYWNGRVMVIRFYSSGWRMHAPSKSDVSSSFSWVNPQ